MNKWFEPDSRWKIQDINSLEDYIDKFVFRSKFHSNVPEDILKDYEVVEYLMAHAYYFWPLYDEVFKKLISMFEMSIKLKCASESIIIQTTNKNGKKVNRSLYDLIEDLITKMNWEEQENIFFRNRWLRNSYAHPERHSFMGGLKANSVLYQINFFNQLFWPENWFQSQKDELKSLKAGFKILEDDVFILHLEGKDILVYNPKPIKAFKLNNEWIHFWVVYPVLESTYNYLNNSTHFEPLSFFIKNEKVGELGLTAINVEDKAPFKLIKTKKEENVRKYLKHINELQKIDSPFFTKGTPKTDLKYQQFLYENCWE